MLDGLPVRQAGQALEHHDDGHHRRGHAAAPLVGEELVREELVALAVQDRLGRALGKGLFAEAVQVVEPVALAASQAEAHSPVSSKRGSDTPVILARYLGSSRISAPRGYLPPLRPPPRGRSRQRRQQPPRSRAQPGPLLGPKAGRHRHEGGCRQVRERHQPPDEAGLGWAWGDAGRARKDPGAANRVQFCEAGAVYGPMRPYGAPRSPDCTEKEGEKPPASDGPAPLPAGSPREAASLPASDGPAPLPARETESGPPAGYQ